MKRILFSISAFCVVLCASAQARFSSNTETIDLGQIEWKHPTTAQYTITNTGTAPLVLTDVQPDCACTSTRWTDTPIAPGAKGTVNVTFDAQALGHFQKSIAIYTNAEPHLVRLKLEGEVVTEIKDFTRTHPYLFGQIRIDHNEIDFPDVNLGENPVMQIGVVNLSDRPYEPVLMHLPSYLQMEVTPRVLQKGEKGVITLTLLSHKLTDLGLTQSSVYLSKFTGDKVSEENEIPVSAILLPGFNLMTQAEKENAPMVSLSSREVDLSSILAKKSKAKHDITLTNTGKSPLQISKLQVFHPAVGVDLKKSLIMPGESTRLRITVVKKEIGKRKRHLRVLMITNDPMQPKVEIDLKAE